MGLGIGWRLSESEHPKGLCVVGMRRSPHRDALKRFCSCVRRGYLFLGMRVLVGLCVIIRVRFCLGRCPCGSVCICVALYEYFRLFVSLYV